MTISSACSATEECKPTCDRNRLTVPNRVHFPVSKSFMDPITHGITGALLGKGYFSDRQGRVATFAAVLGAVFPDVDVIVESFSPDPLAIVRYHRGITHSFVALPFFAALLAWLTRWVARRFEIESPSWGILTVICGGGLASHIILDGMTSFGTRMWYPLSQKRVAWDFLFIIDFTFTALILLPQVIAWIYNQTGRDYHISSTRAIWMWLLFTFAAMIAWGVAFVAGYPFHVWIVGFASALLVALFFLPGIDGWGFRVKRSSWCQAGTYVMVAYLVGCGIAHHSAMLRMQHFAEENHIDVVRQGALPVPPSWLDWGDVIRTTNGVYLARIDLRHAEHPSFDFVPDSPPNPFTARALKLPEVRLYWQFARFPTIHTSTEGNYHIVDFSEHRFTNGRPRSPQPFSYRVVFNADGAVVAQGWLENGLLRRNMKRLQLPRAGAPAGSIH
ncbi:MAG: metal-dependent hydrolase [Ktedonobacteraceae bacterium]